MTRSEYVDIILSLHENGRISESTMDEMIGCSSAFMGERDERFPASYAEIEYDDMESEEAVMGCHFDDMNYLRYYER